MNPPLIAEESAVTPCKADGAVAVRVFRSLSEVEKIRNVWTLWNSHPNADIELYFLVEQLRSEIVRPHILVLYMDECPQAMLIGRILEDRMNVKAGYKTIVKPKARLLNFVWGGALGNLCRGNSEVMVKQIENSLRHGEADLAVFNNIATDTALYQAATQVPGFVARDRFPLTQIHRCIVLPSSFEEFRKGLPKNVRKNQKSEAKQLMEKFGENIEIRCFRRPSELERLICDVEEIARKTYQRGLGVGFVADEEMRRRLHLDAKSDRLRAFLLYLAGKPCAFWLGTVYQNVFHGGYVGFDPAYKQFSPGTFLTMRVIEGFCDHRGDIIREIDFGIGDAHYKQVLSNRSWQDGTVYIFGPSVKGLTVNIVRTPIILIDQLAKRILKRAGALRIIKKVWRDRVLRK